MRSVIAAVAFGACVLVPAGTGSAEVATHFQDAPADAVQPVTTDVPDEADTGLVVNQIDDHTIEVYIED